MGAHKERYELLEKRIRKLPKLIGDPEALHAERDAIFIEILRWIAAEKCTYTHKWAKLALKAYDHAGGDLWF